MTMHPLMLAAILSVTPALTLTATAQDAPAPKPPADITRTFSVQDVAVIGAICDMAIWANRIQAEPACKTLMQRLARTPADDAPPQDKPPKKK